MAKSKNPLVRCGACGKLVRYDDTVSTLYAFSSTRYCFTRECMDYRDRTEKPLNKVAF